MGTAENTRDELASLIGAKVDAIGFDAIDGGTAYLCVTLKDGNRADVYLRADAEGNNGGYLDIVRHRPLSARSEGGR